jgi:glycosyltransferase involved in cell wall biosynthesis
MKKLLVVGDFISGSGLTQVIFNVFSRFPAEQFKIEAVGYGQDPSQYTDRKCAELGWPLHRVVPVTKNPIEHWRWWKQYFKQHSYDIAYFNYSSSWNYLPVVYAKRYGHVPTIVCHSHNAYFSHEFSNPVLMKALTVLNNHGKKVFNHYANLKVATSDEAASWMFGEENTKDVYISVNGLDLPKFQYDDRKRSHIRNQFSLAAQTKLIGFVGVLQERKNPLFALEAFAKYHEINSDSKFVMLGKGPLKESINSRIKELGLADDVIQIDFAPNVNEWYSAMDAFLFPSKYEGFGLVALEAQISNLPVLASSTNIEKIFATKNIKKMNNLDPISWGKELATMLDHSPDRDHLDPSLQEFSVDFQSEKLQQLLV